MLESGCWGGEAVGGKRNTCQLQAEREEKEDPFLHEREASAARQRAVRAAMEGTARTRRGRDTVTASAKNNNDKKGVGCGQNEQTANVMPLRLASSQTQPFIIRLPAGASRRRQGRLTPMSCTCIMHHCIPSSLPPFQERGPTTTCISSASEKCIRGAFPYQHKF